MLESIPDATPRIIRKPAAYRHFPYDFHLNLGGGAVSIPDARGVQGLFLTGFWFSDTGTIVEMVPDEVYEFEHKGCWWRATFVLVYDNDARKSVPFRIDLDFIRRVG